MCQTSPSLRGFQVCFYAYPSADILYRFVVALPSRVSGLFLHRSLERRVRKERQVAIASRVSGLFLHPEQNCERGQKDRSPSLRGFQVCFYEFPHEIKGELVLVAIPSRVSGLFLHDPGSGLPNTTGRSPSLRGFQVCFYVRTVLAVAHAKTVAIPSRVSGLFLHFIEPTRSGSVKSRHPFEGFRFVSTMAL